MDTVTWYHFNQLNLFLSIFLSLWSHSTMFYWSWTGRFRWPESLTKRRGGGAFETQATSGRTSQQGTGCLLPMCIILTYFYIQNQNQKSFDAHWNIMCWLINLSLWMPNINVLSCDSTPCLNCRFSLVLGSSFWRKKWRGNWPERNTHAVLPPNALIPNTQTVSQVHCHQCAKTNMRTLTGTFDRL